MPNGLIGRMASSINPVLSASYPKTWQVLNAWTPYRGMGKRLREDIVCCRRSIPKSWMARHRPALGEHSLNIK